MVYFSNEVALKCQYAYSVIMMCALFTPLSDLKIVAQNTSRSPRSMSLRFVPLVEAHMALSGEFCTNFNLISVLYSIGFGIYYGFSCFVLFDVHMERCMFIARFHRFISL